MIRKVGSTPFEGRGKWSARNEHFAQRSPPTCRQCGNLLVGFEVQEPYLGSMLQKPLQPQTYPLTYLFAVSVKAFHGKQLQSR
ncbi:hypothetical protein Q31a_07460 [Aureliella helgolandensis]|uniref:Uncharacterized protein n=1 Tax=Aureliella helgolandensis TaxID=2527968 RepID=A0A518G1I1_9BACT|nr:hypothetical protein Q31a_07460 [Aureliella helgolandensis]